MPIIRTLDSAKDFAACVAFQDLIWGPGFTEVAPTVLLKVGGMMGGVSAGAFDRQGEMVGFVFGISGLRYGELAHWSDMTAVHPEHRNSGLGQRLKQFQKLTLLSKGIQTIYWTFDPLVARNAYLNFSRFGVSIDAYVENMYGESQSPLWNGLGTDRIIVTLDLKAPLPNPELLPWDAFPEMDCVPASAPARFSLAIPADIFAVLAKDPDEGRTWRKRTRRVFQWALQNGYQVRGIHRELERGFCHYLFEKTGARS